MEYKIEALLKLAQTIMPSDPSLSEEITLAARSPIAYFSRFPQRRGASSLGEISPLLPWFALVDGLIERERCREVDWKESPEYVLSAVTLLLSHCKDIPGDWPSIDPSFWEDLPTEAFLHYLWRTLVPEEVVLSYFEIGSDSYPLFVSRVETFPILANLADKSRYSQIIDFSHVDLSRYSEYPEWVQLGVVPPTDDSEPE